MEAYTPGPENTTIIRNADSETIFNFSLVLSSKNITHYISNSGTSLSVNTDDIETALHELSQYQQENVNWPPERETVWYPPFYRPRITFLFFAILGFFFWYTGDWQPASKWFTAGAVNRFEILENGQWWRLATALTLHADIVHFIGNCIVGSHIILLLSRVLGYGLCWFLVIITGMLGNFFNIALRQEQHLSVGFSTAVFATLGIFTGLRLQLKSTASIKDFILPLGAGAGLLVFFGSEGVRTDIGAHFFGFLCGLAAGIICSFSDIIKKTASADRQAVLLTAAFSLIILSWFFAYQHIISHSY